MKIKISYAPDEERDACAAAREMLRLFPFIRVHKDDNNPPYTRLYMTTKQPAKPMIARVELDP